MNKPKKIFSVQYLRGIAALGVVVCHYGSYTSKFFDFAELFVFIFFFISGFVIVYSLIKSKYQTSQFFNFLLKRTIRIDPSYYITVLLSIILFKILALMPSFNGKPLQIIPWQIIAHLIYIIPFTKYHYYIQVFWTLSVEFQFYLLIGIFYFLSEKPAYKIIFIGLFSLSCLLPIQNSANVIFNYAPIFSFGIMLVNFYQNKTVSVALLLALLLILIGFKFSIAASISLLICGIIVIYFKLAIKPLLLLGNISYSLYLSHPLVIIILLGIEKKLHINIKHFQTIPLIIHTSIAIAYAYCFYILIEKPSIKLSQSIFRKELRIGQGKSIGI